MMSFRTADEMVELATAAYLEMTRYPVIPEQPSKAASGVIEHEGTTYVRLANARGTIAVYSVRGAMMKRLERWPAAIDERQNMDEDEKERAREREVHHKVMAMLTRVVRENPGATHHELLQRFKALVNEGEPLSPMLHEIVEDVFDDLIEDALAEVGSG
jgi:hypothetical protein